MKIAIDTSALKSGHRFRGIGFYTKNLVEALKKIDKKNQYFGDADLKVAQKADLIHYPYFHPFFKTLPSAKRKKTVVTIHDLTPLVFPDRFPPGFKGRLRFFFQKRTLRKVEAIITDSQTSKKDILRFLKIDSSRVEVIYLAPAPDYQRIKISTTQERTIRKKYRLPEKFVLYVGDVNYNKNILGLVAACKQVQIPLVIVGKQAAEKNFDLTHIENQPLVQLIKLYKKDPGVLRLGFVPTEDLVIIYHLAVLYCQPSFYEGFGLPVLEAMACGCPVVASSTSSLPEVGGQAALWVNPWKLNDLAKGIKLVLNDDRLAKKLIKKGLVQAKKFSWEKTAKKTLRVYEKVYRQK